MTVDGVPRPRPGPTRPRSRRPFPSTVWAATIAPPWQRVPDARTRGTVTLVARNGRPVEAPTGGGPHRPASPGARPRVVEDPGILGLSRLARSRVGSRLFTLFFVAVFALIAVQTLVELLHG